MSAPPPSIDALHQALRERSYVADRGLATSLFVALKLKRPLFLEGEAGVGKTEVAKVVADMLGAPLIRLQCYEGLDVNTTTGGASARRVPISGIVTWKSERISSR